MMSSMQERLAQILQRADAQVPLKSDAYGVKTVAFKKGELPAASNHAIEVRYFTQASYNRTKTEDFIERVNFLANVAVQEANGEENKINTINGIRRKYLEIIQARFHLKINDKNPENFYDVFDNVKVFEGNKKIVGIQTLFLHCQGELITEIYGASTKKLTKRFSRASQEFLAEQGRPIIINVVNQQSIHAHFPKNEKTYPSTYQEDPESGINPNSVMDIVAYRTQAGGPVDVRSLASRAVSFASKTNAQADIINLLRQSGRGPYRSGQRIYIDSTSLLTPEKRALAVGATVFLSHFESETTQAEVHHKALMDLDGQEIEIDGVKVILDTNHMNISVKDPDKIFAGSAFVINQKLLDDYNKKGFKKYIQNQRISLQIEHAVDANTPFERYLRDPRIKRDHQKRYFYEVCCDFYSKKPKYKTSQHEAYLFAAKKIRSEELRREKNGEEVFVLWNCKSSRDRSDWESAYLKTLIDAERALARGVAFDFDSDFKPQLAINHEFSPGQEANGKGAPGARGNRVDDPTKQDKSKIDSRTSRLSKIHTTKRKLMQQMARAKAQNVAANSVIQQLLTLNGDKRFAELVAAFHDIQSPSLRVAMVAVLDSKDFDLPEGVDIFAIVKKINGLFPDTELSFKLLKKKYGEFLKIVEPIPGLNDLRETFISAMLVDGKKEDIKKLKKDEPNKIPEYLRYLDSAIILAEKFDFQKAKELSRYRTRLARAISRGLHFGNLEKEEPATHVYIYDSDPAAKEKFKALTDSEKEEMDLTKEHTVYESENQMRYFPPRNEEEADEEIIWQVIQKAVRKFGVSDPRTLIFEGKLKEKAEEIIERHMSLSLNKTAEKNDGIEILVPEEQKQRTFSRSPMAAGAA